MHEFHDEAMILELLDAAIRTDKPLTDGVALARLDNCETCMTDLAEQREMIRHLGGLPQPVMSSDERSALHLQVDAALDTAVVTSIDSRRPRDWTRLGTVAAALVGVVAVAGLFTSFGGTTSLDKTTIPPEPPTAGLTAQAADGGGSDTQDDLAADGEAYNAAESGSSAADTAAIAAPSNLVRDVGSVNETVFESELDDIRNDVANLQESSGILQRQLNSVDASCLDEVPDRGAIRAVLTATVDGIDVEVYLDVHGEEFGFAGDTCSPYDLP